MIGVGLGVGSGNKSVGYLGADVTIVTSSNPDQPTIYGGTITETTWNLTSSAFSDDDVGDTHAMTDWQVTTSGDTGYASPVFESLNDSSNLTSIQATGLTGSTEYIARCRHKDSQGNWSSYSSNVTDTTDAPPGGTSPIYEDGFETADMSYNDGGFSWHSRNRTSIVYGDGADDNYVAWPTESGPWAGREWENSDFTSGTYAMRFRYPAGEAWSEQRWSFPTADALSEIWLQWDLRVPINFYHSSGDNKLFMFWMDDYSNRGDGSTCGMEFRPDSPTGSSRFFCKVSQGKYNVLGGDQASTSFIVYPDDQGKWMRLYVYLKAETSEDAADGIFKVWRQWYGGSKVLTHDLSGQKIRIPASGPNGFRTGYLMGWANGAYSENTEFLLDNFMIYDSDPGW